MVRCFADTSDLLQRGGERWAMARNRQPLDAR
jgi:hypothetical protein